jgi:hypothetical protein
MAARRQFAFDGLDDVMPDVERLLAGHVTLGRWTLGQICNHLASALLLTVESPPGASGPTSRQQEVFRRLFFRSARFPEGRGAPLPALIPGPGLVDRIEAERLRAAIDRFLTSTGPFSGHPALGPLNKEEWDRFHRMHCAHHLGFAVPR